MGLPHARQNPFQLAPPDPPQGAAETLSQNGGASGKMCLRKGRRVRTEEKKKKSVRNNPENTKFTEEGYGGGAPGPW